MGSLVADITYNEPIKKDVAVMFCYFNYTNSSRILMNYLYTVEKMRLANIPIFTIELVIKGKQPDIAEAEHVYSTSYLFQKENLFRVLEKKIPKHFKKLLCLDSDIIFSKPTWYAELSNLLDTNDVVHCFERAYWLDITYKKIEHDAYTYVMSPNKEIFPWQFDNNNRRYHCGFGWAFKRQWYNQSGFYDMAIIGSGDGIFAYALFGKEYPNIKTCRFYKRSINVWRKTIQTPKVSYIRTDVYHLFHGTTDKRQYLDRNEIFKNVPNIEEIIRRNEFGVYSLSDVDLNKQTYRYFLMRSDDSK